MTSHQQEPAAPEQADPGQGKKLRPGRTTATRQKLFDASMELIGERGAAGVTVDEIAAAAGVSKGTVYYNFGSKSDLIAQLLRHRKKPARQFRPGIPHRQQAIPCWPWKQ
jgi:AcrR family transcriptional regulator